MGSSGGNEQAQSGNYALGQSLKSNAVGMSGMQGVDPNHPQYEYVMAGYMDAHNAKVENEKIKLMYENMMEGFASQNNNTDYADAMASQQAAADEAANAARLGGLRSTRDQHISNYFSAANDATNYVSEKIASEKANAALMGVDYNMSDEIKGERISNYFSTLWSEGNQAELEGSFGEVGAGGFEQTMWRGAGNETGPAEGSVGEEKTGGSIKPKPTLIDEENTLGSTSILGA